MKKMMKLSWKDLKVGDMFLDGATITELWPWQEAPCYELRTKRVQNVDGELIEVSDSVIASETHLFSIETDESFDGFEMTRESKAQTNKQAINWIACRDAYEVFKTDLVDELTGQFIARVAGTMGEIEVVPYKNLEPQKCRCITTTHGTFTIGGVLFGQSARGEHSLDSVREIVYQLRNQAGMSEEWIAQNLFLDLEAVKRMQMISGLKASMSDIDDADMAWSPEADESYQRKEEAYLSREATKFVGEYEAANPDWVLPTGKTIIDVAIDLGWDVEAAKKVKRSPSLFAPNGSRREGGIQVRG